ncbi:TlpA disulfide reductase family protein [Sphingobacterium hotanense]|uniref:TlpA disulfide reductase family protein n=1 Tax=Sphingobacterium TaxID=28453 RepID=UPI0021A8E7EC|nr:TlpA disulfide reductase family protein [Sphingobacterium hotanense]MCT1525066.1 AhpC/TSA family protein [Sphingobacterium hotanense]
MKLKIFTICYLLICAGFVSYSQSKKSIGFEIQGYISGIDDGTKIYLYDLDAQTTLDSTFSTQGNFKLAGHVEGPTICWVRCKDEAATILVENRPISFKASLHDMSFNAVVKGGKEQDLHNELRSKQYPYDKIFHSALDSVRNKLYTSNEDKKRLIDLCNNTQTDSHNIYIDFGKRHPNSVLGLDIIYRNREQIGRDTVKLLLSRLDKNLKASSKAKALALFSNGELVYKGASFIDFEVKTLEGEMFKLSSLKGNFILLDFWSIGCGPCREMNKLMSKNYDRLKNKISIVSFSLDKHRSDWQKASKQDNILWFNVSDLEGESGKIKTQYGVQTIPTSFLIDRQGKIVEKFTGYDGEDFISSLEKLIQRN